MKPQYKFQSRNKTTTQVLNKPQKLSFRLFATFEPNVSVQEHFNISLGLIMFCQGNFGPEKFGSGDQCSMKKNGPPRPTFSWNISPVVEFGSAMQNSINCALNDFLQNKAIYNCNGYLQPCLLDSACAG